MSDELDHAPDGFQPDPGDNPEHVCAFPGRCILDGRDHDATECRVREEWFNGMSDGVDLPPAGDEDAQIPPPEEFWKNPHRGLVDVEVFYKAEWIASNPKASKSRVFQAVRLHGFNSALAEATQYVADRIGTRDLSHIALSNFRTS